MKEEEERKKPQDENIMTYPIPQGGYKKEEERKNTRQKYNNECPLTTFQSSQ